MPLLSHFTGLLGITALLGVAFAMSNNRKHINWRLVVSGLSLQVLLAVFCLKVEVGRQIFQSIGHGIEKLLSFSDQGGSFVFGFLVFLLFYSPPPPPPAARRRRPVVRGSTRAHIPRHVFAGSGRTALPQEKGRRAAVNGG